MRSRAIRWILPLLLVLVAGVGVAMAATASMSSKNGTVKTAHSSKYGTILVASNGMTLYRYTPDKKNLSMCSGACASYWPPLVLEPGAKPTAGSGATASLLRTMKRSNGAMQVTYGGWPLYTYAGDKKAGQTNGQGFEKSWYVVGTTGALVKSAVSSSGGTTTKKSAWG